MKPKQLVDLLSKSQVELIKSHVDNAGRRHPAWSTLRACDESLNEGTSKDFLSNEAIGRIYREPNGDQWLAGIVERIAQVNDFAEAKSALAEVRCYGAMLEAEFNVQPVQTANSPTSDFQFDYTGSNGIIEVSTKLEHEDQIDRSRRIAAGETPSGVERSVQQFADAQITTTTSIRHPFGAPNPIRDGDTTQANAISRICAIKGKETQFSNSCPSILWIDLRDLSDWPGFLNSEQAFPLMIERRGRLCSGAIWYAFYGWKHAPIFEQNMDGEQIITPMRHFGRFHRDNPKRTVYSAAIICLEQTTLLFENPGATLLLPDRQRIALTRLPWFDLGHSIANWSSGDVDRSNALAASMIKAL